MTTIVRLSSISGTSRWPLTIVAARPKLLTSRAADHYSPHFVCQNLELANEARCPYVRKASIKAWVTFSRCGRLLAAASRRALPGQDGEPVRRGPERVFRLRAASQAR